MNVEDSEEIVDFSELCVSFECNCCIKSLLQTLMIEIMCWSSLLLCNVLGCSGLQSCGQRLGGVLSSFSCADYALVFMVCTFSL